MNTLSTLTRCLVGAGMVLGLTAQASALPTFTINPDAIPSSTAGSTFTADALSFATSSELLALNPGAGAAAGTATGSGWATISGFSLLGNTVLVGTSRVGLDYGLYITFDLQATLATGTLGNPGSTYTVTQLDFKWFADPSLDNVYTQATAAPVGAATLTGQADDILLAFGSLISGVADLNLAGGTGINTLNTFAVCTGVDTADSAGTAIPPGGTPFMNATALDCANGIGNAYFDTPNPFYALVFSTFSNTSQGVALSADGEWLAINAAGRADFLDAPVPEPGTLALAGLALLGLAGAALRRKA